MEKLSVVLPEDYELSDGEIDNIVYLCCKYTVQFNMRPADLFVCKKLFGQGKRGVESVQELIEITCEYIWDHICGEPDDFTTETLVNHMVPIFNKWFNDSSKEERSNTN